MVIAPKMTLFLNVDYRLVLSTARLIWDQLTTTSPKIDGHTVGQYAYGEFCLVMVTDEIEGKAIYDDLLRACRMWLVDDREKVQYAFLSDVKL